MSTFSALRKLRQQRASGQHWEDFYRQINADKNDRGAAILATTFLEAALENALSRSMANSAANFVEVFDNNGPLSSFDSKLLIAESLGFLGPTTKHNLTIIKHIRNTFAHAAVPIDFSTKEIVNACNVLVIPKLESWQVPSPYTFDTPRERFTSTCQRTGMELHDYASRCVRNASRYARTRCNGACRAASIALIRLRIITA
jgi:DNA-binding MltR family transcriptional regulator